MVNLSLSQLVCRVIEHQFNRNFKQSMGTLTWHDGACYVGEMTNGGTGIFTNKLGTKFKADWVGDPMPWHSTIRPRLLGRRLESCGSGKLVLDPNDGLAPDTSMEIEAERREQMRVEKFAKKKNAFKQAKLKEEIVAPYKGNVIVYLVVGIGVIGTLFALFPQLLETPTLNMGATFPGDL